MSESVRSEFKVEAYEPSKLGKLFGGLHRAYAEDGKTTPHVAYFRKYFEESKPLTVIVEKSYVEHDYLEDYTGFYARCFAEYSRVCRRLHFFTAQFSEDDFCALLRGDGQKLQDELCNAYVGFIVLKPLPETVIGRTCLKPYSQGTTFERQFPITRTYRVNLFGIGLQVESLAFQEQDKAVAACASSAIWSVLQGTGHLFHHAIPSPYEITKTATELFPLESRSLPNDGLTPPQMSAAVRAVGLECDAVDVKDVTLIKRNLYAYLRGRIPLLLGAHLYDSQRDCKYEGRHAMAVVGYHLLKSAPWDDSSREFRLRAARLDKFYVHDDQVGPFARMVSCNSKAAVDVGFTANDTSLNEISNESGIKRENLWLTRWRKPGGEAPAGIVAAPYILLLPLYHKIRMCFESVFNMVRSFDSHIELFHGRRPASSRDPDAHATVLPTPLEWDIYLCGNEDFRKDVHLKIKSGDQRLRLMTTGLPKFMWRAIAYDSQLNRVMEILFDATDVPQGRCILMAIEHRPSLLIPLHDLLNTLNVYEEAETSEEGRVLAWFKHQEQSSGVFSLCE